MFISRHAELRRNLVQSFALVSVALYLPSLASRLAIAQPVPDVAGRQATFDAIPRQRAPNESDTAPSSQVLVVTGRTSSVRLQLGNSCRLMLATPYARSHTTHPEVVELAPLTHSSVRLSAKMFGRSTIIFESDNDAPQEVEVTIWDRGPYQIESRLMVVDAEGKEGVIESSKLAGIREDQEIFLTETKIDDRTTVGITGRITERAEEALLELNLERETAHNTRQLNAIEYTRKSTEFLQPFKAGEKIVVDLPTDAAGADRRWLEVTVNLQESPAADNSR